MAERKTGGKGIQNRECRKLVLADVPDGGGERGEQASGKDAACLQRIQGQDLSGMGGVKAPVIDDVEDFSSNDSGKYDHNSEVPGVIGVDALTLRITYADPEPEQNTGSDQDSVGW